MNNSYLLTCLIVFVLVYQMRENICGGNRLVEGSESHCVSHRECQARGYHHCYKMTGVCISNEEADEQERHDSSICTHQ